MKPLFAFAVATLLSSIFSAAAFASEDLAKAKNCLACHAVDKKMVGPSYKDIGVSYKTDTDGVAKMSVLILKGTPQKDGKFQTKHGPIPMMANAGVSEAEAKTLATIETAIDDVKLRVVFLHFTQSCHQFLTSKIARRGYQCLEKLSNWVFIFFTCCIDRPCKMYINWAFQNILKRYFFMLIIPQWNFQKIFFTL